jgi:MoaA/NifB/PqqE/SkfB family radical SAM enzyme
MSEERRLMRSPKSMDLDITSRCNLRCKYCFQRTGPSDTRTELHTEEWAAFCNELGECSVMSVCIGGGEPFIREDLPDIIDAVVEKRMRF